MPRDFRKPIPHPAACPSLPCIEGICRAVGRPRQPAAHQTVHRQAGALHAKDPGAGAQHPAVQRWVLGLTRWARKEGQQPAASASTPAGVQHATLGPEPTNSCPAGPVLHPRLPARLQSWTRSRRPASSTPCLSGGWRRGRWSYGKHSLCMHTCPPLRCHLLMTMTAAPIQTSTHLNPPPLSRRQAPASRQLAPPCS